MRIDIITIFPKMFEPVLNESIIKRAQNKGKVKIFVHNLRDYSHDKHRKVDDRPFGGGSGMLMRPGPIFRAVEDILRPASCVLRPASKRHTTQDARHTTHNTGHKTQVIFLSPQGKRLNQKIATRLAKHKHLLLICGHYEGVDERVRQYLVDEEISIGDYVLTGGELPAMVLIDTLVRLVPGVLGDKNSLNFESFKGNLLDPSLIGMGKVYPLGLEYPHYTRPAKFRNMRVPPILLSGDHKKIEIWRRKEALKRTKLRRPDLLSV